MPFIELGETRLHYRIEGDEDLPALVLAHSLGVSHAMWEPQWALAKQFRIIAYDLRGHGNSSAPPTPASAERLGRDVLALLDGLGIGRAAFCGLSLGGLVGQCLGIHAPARLTKLVLANTAAKIGNLDGWNARISQVRHNGLGEIAPGTLERWFTANFRAGHPETIGKIRALLEATDPEGYVACCVAVRDADFRDSIIQTAVPTLVIGGTHDPVTPPSDCRWLAENIPGASYTELTAAHLSSVEDATGFNAALLSFLKA